MSQSAVSRTGSGRKRLGCLILFLLILFIGVLAGAVVWLYPRNTLSLPNIAVSILSPQSGYVTELNVRLPVEANASSPSGINRIELYSDGALVAVETSTQLAGADPLIFSQLWAPRTTGRHILTARAYNRENKFADSSVVYLDVADQINPTLKVGVDSIPRAPSSPLPNLNQIASAAHVPLSQLLAANPNLSGRDPNAPLASGTDLEIPRTPPVPDSTAPVPAPLPGTPTAPSNLVAVADCTTAQLTWSDSPDEEQYTIYRLAPGSSHFDPIATLPANTTIYRDNLPNLGSYRYQVAAVRAGLEGLSLTTSVRTPDLCVPPVTVPGASDLLLSFVSIDTPEVFNGIYCYFSINGSSYQRAPEGDFAVLRSDRTRTHFNLQTQLPNRGQLSLGGHRDTDPVTLNGECLGRRGAESLSLGTFSASHPRSEWDGHERQVWLAPSNRQVAELTNLGGTSNNENMPLADRRYTLRYRIGPNTLDGIRSSLDPRLFGYLGRIPSILVPLRTPDPGMPVPMNVTAHINSFCIDPDPGWSICPGERIRWDWHSNGVYTERTITGYRVFVRITDSTVTGPSDPEAFVIDVPGGDNKSVPQPTSLNHVGCGFRVTILVQAYQIDARLPDGVRESIPSDPFTWDTSPCASSARLNVTISPIDIGPSARTHEIRDDGDMCILCTDRQLELYGSIYIYYRAQAPIVALTLTPFADRFFWEYCRGYPEDFCVDAGSSSFHSPVNSPWSISRAINNYSPGPVGFRVRLWDRDMFNSDDQFCFGEGQFVGTGLGNVDVQRVDVTSNFTDDQGEASCHISIHFRGEPQR